MTRVRTPREQRVVRHRRVRKKIWGSPERPRLSVFRSLQHIYAQVIDDARGSTITWASSREIQANGTEGGGKSNEARRVGLLVAQRALEEGVRQVVFDRGGYAYHGRVRALAEAAREGGLSF